MRRKNGDVSWGVVAVVALVMIVAVLAIGAVSAVGRSFDLAEYKAADPYYQSLALREQVVDGGRGDGRLLWVLGIILAAILGGGLLYVATPFMKEARLGYKAIRPRRRPSPRPSPTGRGSLPALPRAPRAALMDGNQPETAEYEDIEEEERVDVWR